MFRSMSTYKRISERLKVKDENIAIVIDYLERVSNSIKAYPTDGTEIFSFLINNNFVLRFYEDDSFEFSEFIWWTNKILFDNFVWIWGTVKNLKS